MAAALVDSLRNEPRSETGSARTDSMNVRPPTRGQHLLDLVLTDSPHSISTKVLPELADHSGAGDSRDTARVYERARLVRLGVQECSLERITEMSRRYGLALVERFASR